MTPHPPVSSSSSSSNQKPVIVRRLVVVPGTSSKNASETGAASCRVIPVVRLPAGAQLVPTTGVRVVRADSSDVRATLSRPVSVNLSRFTEQGTTNKVRRWICDVCGRLLSSKRSYDEHLNTHTNKRPFNCAHCDYVSASQMTLRRHVLRRHTARADWGYQCPYCNDAYMEPASYQQHIQTKHPGRSGTFGCPLSDCGQRTRCAKHFKDHLCRHRELILNNENGDRSIPDVLAACNDIRVFLVDDKDGLGAEAYGKLQLEDEEERRPRMELVPSDRLPVVAEEEIAVVEEVMEEGKLGEYQDDDDEEDDVQAMDQREIEQAMEEHDDEDEEIDIEGGGGEPAVLTPDEVEEYLDEVEGKKKRRRARLPDGQIDDLDLD